MTPLLRIAAAAALLGVVGAGCAVGPDFVRPDPPVAEGWRDADAPAVDARPAADSRWWGVFGDPILDDLVAAAHAGNPTLRAAAARILQARARRGIAAGNLFPQSQQAAGGWTRAELSRNRANQTSPGLLGTFNDVQIGFDAAWELDVWGRFRRGIEAAEAELLAAGADYDDVLVSLAAEVARTYTEIRVLEARLDAAERNVAIQQRSADITRAKFRNGVVTELDVAQARSLLAATRAAIPALAASLRQAENALCTLLGLPPQDLRDRLGPRAPIPAAPQRVAVGIPADLLRRRPDVRAVEQRLAAQSARIGIAASDLYPQLSLVGSIQLAAEDFADLAESRSLEAFGGPSFRWSILNYGRIRNNVRVQEAAFQELIAAYETTVLIAQQEVENALAALLGARREAELRAEAVAAARRAAELSGLQYREGAIDYVRVLNAQAQLASEEDRLASTRGNVTLAAVALYKALGGGWEPDPPSPSP